MEISGRKVARFDDFSHWLAIRFGSGGVRLSLNDMFATI